MKSTSLAGGCNLREYSNEWKQSGYYSAIVVGDSGTRHSKWRLDIQRHERPKTLKNYRLEIIAELGGKCQWEGCDITDTDILQIDHVHGGGSKERRRMGLHKSPGLERGRLPSVQKARDPSHYYLHILGRLHTGDYQVLCANHNVKKAALERQARRDAQSHDRQYTA